MAHPQPPGPLKYFVSYTRVDKAWAEWVAFELELLGHQAIIEAWDFHAGNNFILEMHKAATTADHTVTILTPAFLNSVFTKPEWAAAFVQDPTGDQRKLIGVRVQPCNPPGLLSALGYIDLVGLNEDQARTKFRTEISGGRAKPLSVPFPGNTTARPRFPGALPACWNIGSRNNNYLDRDNLLERLHGALQSAQHAAALTQAVTGLGGVGKSTLAVEYAHAFAADYDIVWRLGAETNSTVVTGLANLAREANVAEAGVPEPNNAQAALRWLRGQ